MNPSPPSDSKCPQCDAPLPPDSVGGLCPRCLMLGAMQPTQVEDPVPALSPLTPEELAPHFPQLEILECLGRGGMGVVYKARQKTLNRVVALKLMAPERAADPEFASRFEKEAQALATLNHPSIVGVYDFGQAGGFYFLLMEFVDGVNLRQAMKARQFTPEQALAVVPPVCEALQFAHEHGIVHRDIKPENLLLDKEGRIKIADFGIAKMLNAEDSDIGVAESQPVGTPQYMAPEQRDHRRTDHRADIYSLGVVLYEMLTGELPNETLQPPSRKIQIDVRLDEVVMRALEVSPELRYQSASEMGTLVQTLAVPRPDGSQGKSSETVPVRRIKKGYGLLTTAEKLATAGGQFLAFRTRGRLTLDSVQLTHTLNGTDTVIPLATIRDVSGGLLPRAVNPYGLALISVTFDEGGQLRRLLISPTLDSLIGMPQRFNDNVDDWLIEIREAVTAATGHAPTETGPAELQLPRSHVALALFPLILIAVPVIAAISISQNASIARHLPDADAVPVSVPDPRLFGDYGVYALAAIAFLITYVLLKSREIRQKKK